MIFTSKLLVAPITFKVTNDLELAGELEFFSREVGGVN